MYAFGKSKSEFRTRFVHMLSGCFYFGCANVYGHSLWKWAFLFCVFFLPTNQPHTLLFLLRFRYDSLVAVFSSLTMDNSIAFNLDVVYLCLYSIAWSNYINFNSNAHMKAQTSLLFYKTSTQLTQSLWTIFNGNQWIFNLSFIIHCSRWCYTTLVTRLNDFISFGRYF